MATTAAGLIRLSTLKKKCVYGTKRREDLYLSHGFLPGPCGPKRVAMTTRRTSENKELCSAAYNALQRRIHELVYLKGAACM